MARDNTEDRDDGAAQEDDGHIYVDRDKIDFDPADGLLSGTALDGTSEIPGSGGDPDTDSDSGESAEARGRHAAPEND
ncbi:MAG: hypothetical protein ACRDVG_09380 [Jatrophihabitantaceae bacterium]